ncbi:hypothetical protein BLA29_000755 [Euroglyphus maynei]|uniref:Uncharacterized protein n=1 Tax=Euroglyphus maynei TaxID=6958 RepID=A0A1Y3B9Y1_EURMA|nr:hypothetical protein BLA29_000755 [Euroglyphus maynei]
MLMNRGGGDYRNSLNHQYSRAGGQPPSLTSSPSSGMKRDYHGSLQSNANSGPIGGPAVKFSKHSYHDRRSDYDRNSSGGGHHGGSSWSSKHDGYRNDSNRYYHHTSPNKNNTPYNNRSNDHQQRPYDQRSQRPPNIVPMGYNRHLPPPLGGTTSSGYPSNGAASLNHHQHPHHHFNNPAATSPVSQSWNSGSTPALLPTPPQPIQPSLVSSPNNIQR